MCWSTPLMPTRNFMPAAATGSSANGRDRMLGTTWAILYDRVTTHARVMRWPWSAPAAWNFVAALLASPGLAVLVPTQRHADVAGNLLHDAHTAILMRKHGIGRICTRFQSIPVPRSD
jgi:hypothetical protein